MGRIAADLGCSSFREEPKVRRLFAGGKRIRTVGPARQVTVNERQIGSGEVPAAQTVCLRASCCSPVLISSSALVRFSTIL
jgi:hypothetical protein